MARPVIVIAWITLFYLAFVLGMLIGAGVGGRHSQESGSRTGRREPVTNGSAMDRLESVAVPDNRFELRPAQAICGTALAIWARTTS
jgi:hypothetical protein